MCMYEDEDYRAIIDAIYRMPLSLKKWDKAFILYVIDNEIDAFTVGHRDQILRMKREYLCTDDNDSLDV